MNRIEKDSLGNVEIPAKAYWGTTTQRALESYPISGLTAHPKFVDAYVILKMAAARANKKAKAITAKQAGAIEKACKEILSGKLRDQFVVDVFQMGAGTSFHMNVNEVIANRANEILGAKIGEYAHLDANNHVNFGQSTNDTFPTAMRLAALLMLRDHLDEPLANLEKSLRAKGKEFDKVLKSGRTHLQDAVPIRLGQEFKAYAEAIKYCAAFISFARKSVCELGIGGSAAGTGLNTARGYREAIVKEMAAISGIRDLKPSPDMCEAMQSQRPLAELSAGLRNLALEISRISNDLRLLCSGPTTGMGEIILPSIAPGSSIMPGKVNPSIPEMVNMVCFEVIGNDTAISWAVGAGQLELNVMMPLMAHKINTSIHVMGSMMTQFANLCIKGTRANEKKCRQYAEGSMSLATALNAYIGYKEAAAVVKQAIAEEKTIIQIVRERKLLTEDQIRKIMDPIKMTEPGIPGK
ncbi:aspartate ammonia-lyase [Candidatus Sumerlaeota bacterium]|nr:aspartate ammonia-lyase [Candidatus Sumerlaeota bacterium]HNM45968.1 aspartate ammonia-lyase [Candidatus Sumerlaeota bacterium]